MWRWAWLSVGLAASVYAQSSVGHHNGVYLYAAARGDHDRIVQAIESATADLNFMQRGIARKRLEASTEPFARFQVHFVGERVLLRMAHHEYDLPLSGRASRMEGLTGSVVSVSATLHGEDLRQVFRGDKGSRYLDYQFHADGSVTLQTTIESEYLPQHIVYALHYRRSD